MTTQKKTGPIVTSENEEYNRARNAKTARELNDNMYGGKEVITEERLLDNRKIHVTQEQYDKAKALGIDVSMFEVKDRMAEARKKKAEALNERADEFYRNLLAFADLLDPVDAMFRIGSIGNFAVRNHFQARMYAERQQAKLDASGEGDMPSDVRPTGLEIDPVQSNWDNIERNFRKADAEHVLHLAAIKAQNALYKQYAGDRDVQEPMAKAAITAVISEQGYARYCEQQDLEWMKSRRNERAASQAATRADYETRSYL